MSEQKKAETRYGLWILLSIWSIFAMAQCVGSIDPILDAISEHFDISNTQALYASTTASIVAGFFGLAVGALAGRKVRYKTVGIFGSLCLVAGGVLPYFSGSSLAFLIAMRVIFGIGMGIMMCMQNPVTTALIPVEQRARILGTGMFFGFGMQCILQFFGGLLVDMFGWNCSFLLHLLLVLPTLMVIFVLPDPGMTAVEAPENPAAMSDDTGSPADAGAAGTLDNKKAKLPGMALALCVMWGISFMMIVPLLVGCAFLSTRIIDSAMWAGVVSVCFSLGAMTGGLSFNRLMGVFNRRVASVSLLLMAVGSIGCAFARHILLLCLFNFIAGVGMASLQAGIMMILGIICPPTKVGLASSIMVSLQNILAFCCSMYEEFVGLFAGGDTVYAPLYVGTVFYLLCAVILLIKSPFPKDFRAR